MPIVSFPAFFEQAPCLQVYDPLAELLGAPVDGILTYRYADAVRLAGHSCPTVASAYLLGRRLMQALYPTGLPQRGGIELAFAAPCERGVTGVQAAVLSLLTGAAAAGGFKGLGGQYGRRDLLRFGVGGTACVQATRCDTGARLVADLDLAVVPGDPAMMPLLQACLSGQAEAETRRAFGVLWQGRVRRMLLEHADDPALVRLRPAPSAQAKVLADAL